MTTDALTGCRVTFFLLKKRRKMNRPAGDLVVEAPARFPQTSFCGTPRPSLGYEQFPTAFAIRTLPFAHPADSLVPFRFTEESRTHKNCSSRSDEATVDHELFTPTCHPKSRSTVPSTLPAHLFSASQSGWGQTFGFVPLNAPPFLYGT